LQDTAGDNSDDDKTDIGENSTYPDNDTVLMPFMNNTQDITCDMSSRNLTGVNLVAAPNKVNIPVLVATASSDL